MESSTFRYPRDAALMAKTPTTTLAARAGFSYGRGLGNSTSTVDGHLSHGHNGGVALTALSLHASFRSCSAETGRALLRLPHRLASLMSSGCSAGYCRRMKSPRRGIAKEYFPCRFLKTIPELMSAARIWLA